MIAFSFSLFLLWAGGASVKTDNDTKWWFSFSLFLMSDFWSIFLYCRFFLCSFSSSSSVGSGTRFWLVAPSGSAPLLPHIAGLLWGTYWIKIPFRVRVFDTWYMDNASFELSAHGSSLPQDYLKNNI